MGLSNFRKDAKALSFSTNAIPQESDESFPQTRRRLFERDHNTKLENKSETMRPHVEMNDSLEMEDDFVTEKKVGVNVNDDVDNSKDVHDVSDGVDLTGETKREKLRRNQRKFSKNLKRFSEKIQKP